MVEMHDRRRVAQVLAAAPRCWSAAPPGPCPRRRTSCSRRSRSPSGSPRGRPRSSPRPRPSAPASPGRAPRAAARAGAGSFSQVPNRSIARFALSQSRSKTRPLATSASVTAAVAAASSRIRLPDDQRSGRASSRWRPTKSGRTSTSPSMKTRNSASEVAIARLRIAFFRKPASSCQTCRTASSGCAAANPSTTARVSAPDPSSATAMPCGGTVLPRHRREAERERPRVLVGRDDELRPHAGLTAPSRSAPDSRAPPGPRPRRPRCWPPSAAPSARTPRAWPRGSAPGRSSPPAPPPSGYNSG